MSCGDNRGSGLLDADICGIFLREDDELVMRGCVGNHMVQTSRLRMRRGQGLAGLRARARAARPA